MRYLCVCILFLATNIYAQVQEVVTPFSGMADIGNAFFSPWAVFSNQAGIARLTDYYVATSYRQVLGLQALSTKTVFVVAPTSWGTPALTYTHYGYEKYNEQLIGLAYGRSLARWLDIGIRIDYLFSKVEKQPGIRQAYFFETGLLFTLPGRIVMGVHVYNPANIARLTAPSQLYVAVCYSGAFAWKADEVFVFAMQVDWVDAVFYFSSGIEWTCIDFLKFRCGFKSRYNSMYAGIGVEWKKWEMNVNYNTHSRIGGELGVGLGMKF